MAVFLRFSELRSKPRKIPSKRFMCTVFVDASFEVIAIYKVVFATNAILGQN